MKITILGSGTCVPRLARGSCAVLVEIGYRAKILLDVGPGTMHRLLQYGVTIFDLTHIVLSHFHPDHSAELVPLLFATKYSDSTQRQRPLHLIGGPGLTRFYAGLHGVYGDWIVLPGGLLNVHELNGPSAMETTWDGFTLLAQPVAHRPESLSIRIQSPDGMAMAYSGDTEPCPALAEVARQADLFICESAMPDELRVPGHMTPGLAGQAATQAQAKRLVLTHLYPPCDEVDIAKQAARTYKGPVMVAEDLMSFILQ
jgi:ribonuclease BN (tRNA processing enzyme)